MLGTKVIYEGAGGHVAEKLAKAFGPQLVQAGGRRLWEYPKGGAKAGTPARFGTLNLTHVSVYYDGTGVFLYMGGPDAPTTTSALADLTRALRVTISCSSVEMVSHTEI